MTNLEHFLIAYKHIICLSLPDSGTLKSLILNLKFSADSIFENLSRSDCIDITLLADKPTPSVSLGAKREGRRNKA